MSILEYSSSSHPSATPNRKQGNNRGKKQNTKQKQSHSDRTPKPATPPFSFFPIVMYIGCGGGQALVCDGRLICR
jgi:hypothetical protein